MDTCTVIALSWVAAVVCCLGYGVSSLLQSIGAQRVATSGANSMVAIATQPPYLLGLACDGLGFLANIVAARELPLFLVQSVLTASVAVTALLAVLRGARLHWLDWTAVAALCLGLALLAAGARTGPPSSSPPLLGWVLLAAVVIPVLIATIGLRVHGRSSWVLLAVASGIGFGVVAVAARGLGTVQLSWAWIGYPLTWAIVLSGVVGMICFALSLQRGPVTGVTAISFAVELVAPTAVGIAVFHDRVAPGWLAPAAVGFVLAVCGSLNLARRVS